VNISRKVWQLLANESTVVYHGVTKSRLQWVYLSLNKWQNGIKCDVLHLSFINVKLNFFQITMRDNDNSDCLTLTAVRPVRIPAPKVP